MIEIDDNGNILSLQWNQKDEYFNNLEMLKKQYLKELTIESFSETFRKILEYYPYDISKSFGEGREKNTFTLITNKFMKHCDLLNV